MIPKLPVKPSFSMRQMGDYPTFNDIAINFHDWYDNCLVPWHKQVFEVAIEVTGHKGTTSKRWIFGDNVHAEFDTHKALLINITSIKEETAEDILRELISECRFPTGALLKAKEFLEKKK